MATQPEGVGPARGTTSVEADAGPAADARTDLSPFEAGNMRDLEDPATPTTSRSRLVGQYADEGSPWPA
jgi:hypothetical protein